MVDEWITNPATSTVQQVYPFSKAARGGIEGVE